MVSRSVSIFFLLLILSLWFVRPVVAGPDRQLTGDYLIIEEPAALKIYNKYEQKINSDDAELFKPFCALRLTDSNITLSDNFTLADRIEIEGMYFYLLKTNRQTLDVSQSAGYLKELRGVRVIEDTVVISRENMFYLQTPGSSAKTVLPAGTLLPAGCILRRIFFSGNMTYIQILDETRQYGWCNLSAKSGWHKLLRPVAETDLSVILKRIQPVFDRYNSLYRNSFQYFNAQTGEQRAIPYWQVEMKNKRITGKLLNISSAVSLQNSLPYLINEVQQHLRNTHLQITQMTAGIEIK